MLLISFDSGFYIKNNGYQPSLKPPISRSGNSCDFTYARLFCGYWVLIGNKNIYV